MFLLSRRIENKCRKIYGNHSKLLSSKKILERNFKIKSGFIFIQVGANDGISFDFLYDFLINRKPIGLVIEPIKDYYDELRINYLNFSGIIPINKAVHPTSKVLDVYKINPDSMYKYPEWVKGIASLDSHHHKKLKIESEDVMTETVIAETFMKICDSNSFLGKIDYLQIDTEGFDLEILRMIDFDILSPKMIKFENVNLSNVNKKEANNMLQRQSYFLFDELGDTIGVNLKLIKLF